MTELPLIALAAALAAGQATAPAATAPAQTAPAAASGNPTAAAGGNPTAAAGGNPTVGGAAMLPTRTVVQNASAAPNLTTLVAAVKAAGLVPTLSGAGPFTVFAPTNDAFGRLAPGTVENLLKPENKPTLVKILTYHVVPGAISSAQLTQMVTAGGGTAKLTTVEGEPLTVTVVNNIVTLTDIHGNKSYVETADVRQANGIVHVVNGVVLPTVN